MSLAEIKTAIEHLSFEERAELAAWLHCSPRRVRPMADWNDDEWDDQMKRDIADGKLDSVLREVEQAPNEENQERRNKERRYEFLFS